MYTRRTNRLVVQRMILSSDWQQPRLTPTKPMVITEEQIIPEEK